jgi:hypothetical protein
MMAIAWLKVGAGACTRELSRGREHRRGHVAESEPEGQFRVQARAKWTYRSGTITFSLVDDVEAFGADGTDDMCPLVLLLGV